MADWDVSSKEVAEIRVRAREFFDDASEQLQQLRERHEQEFEGAILRLVRDFGARVLDRAHGDEIVAAELEEHQEIIESWREAEDLVDFWDAVLDELTEEARAVDENLAENEQVIREDEEAEAESENE